MRLELRHLQIVCAIADHGSVTKAASALGLAQPALTAQLQRIERSLGGSLFERDRRGARPTALGDLVLSRARIVLPAVEGLQEEVTRLATDRETRCYRIGATNGPILSGLVHRLTAADPHAHLSTHSSWSSAELTDMLAAGRLDYVLAGVCGSSPPPGGTELAWQEIAVDAVFVLLPERHALARATEVDLADLSDEHWVATPGGKNCFRECFVGACARAGFAPRNVYEGDVRTCVELVEAGDAVALCQSSFRPPPGLVSLPIAGTPLRWRHLLGWHPDSTAAPDAERVSAYAMAAYQDAAARLPRLRTWLADQPYFGSQAVDDRGPDMPASASQYD